MIYTIGTIFKTEKNSHLSIESITVDDVLTSGPTVYIGYKVWTTPHDTEKFEPIEFDDFLEVLEEGDYKATIYAQDRLQIVVNPDDKDYHDHVYLVSLAQIVPTVAVYADYEGEAVDIMADYAEENGWHGLFLDDSDLEDYTEDDICHVGNFCNPVLGHEIYCQEV